MSEEHRPIVLLVEDEEIVRELIAEALREAGMAVIEAESADAAMGLLMEGVLVSFLVTDVQMPGSMDGLELARRVQADYPTIGVLVTSSKPAPAASAFEFIQKPYEPSAVAVLVKSRLSF